MKACCFFQGPKGTVLAKESRQSDQREKPRKQGFGETLPRRGDELGQDFRAALSARAVLVPLTTDGRPGPAGGQWYAVGRGRRRFPTGREVGACSRGLAQPSPASCRQLLVHERSAVCPSSRRGAGVESELPPAPGGTVRSGQRGPVPSRCRVTGGPRAPASASRGRFWLPEEDDGGRGFVWGYRLLTGGL